jgi:hypothetical protein
VLDHFHKYHMKIIVKGKGKAIPLQAWEFQEVEFSYVPYENYSRRF